MNAVIGIGYGASTTRGALSASERADFRFGVHFALTRIGKLLAVIDGLGYSPGWGQEISTWFAIEFDLSRLAELQSELRRYAQKFGQDSIALTLGSTELIAA